MQIELTEMTIRDVVSGYEDLEEDGVTGYDGRLNIRPKYQREFVYNEKQRDEVIHTIMQGFPLNTMYWMKAEDGSFELLDGQQRTVSFCQYYDGVFAFDNKYFHNLQKDVQDKFLDYRLFVYVCEGTDSERLDWFRIINIAGEKLTEQELRNAVYTGPWLTSAKRRFSKTSCVAEQLAGKYMRGSTIRQDYLEAALTWAAAAEGESNIEKYMAAHQHDENADELWQYFKMAFTWFTGLFPTYNGAMKGLPFGLYYNDHKDDRLNASKLAKRVGELMADEDVTHKSGIYEYLLDGDERCLSIRAFTPNQKQEAYARQKGVCVKCGKHFELDQMEGDHITPWSLGGRTTAENCQMLCKDCNRRKAGA